MAKPKPKFPWPFIRDGVHYMGWYDADAGRSRRQSLEIKETCSEAEHTAAMADWYAKRAGGVGASSAAQNVGGISVATALDQYYAEHVATGPVVAKDRQEYAIRNLKAFFKHTQFNMLGVAESRAYRNARLNGLVGGTDTGHRRQGADSTIYRELTVLKAAAFHAELHKRMGSTTSPPTPMPAFEFPILGKSETLWLTVDELTLARESATGTLQDFIAITYALAARKTSIERMTKFQVNLRASTIDLTSPHESAVQQNSKKRRPIVPLFPEIRPVVERLMMATPDSEWLFGEPAPMYMRFRTHLRNLGMADRAHPHVLRHSRATHLLNDGRSIRDVAKLLGDTIATVERVYDHALAADTGRKLSAPLRAV